MQLRHTAPLTGAAKDNGRSPLWATRRRDLMTKSRHSTKGPSRFRMPTVATTWEELKGILRDRGLNCTSAVA